MFSWSRLSSYQSSTTEESNREVEQNQNSDKPAGYTMHRALSIRSHKSTSTTNNNNNASSGSSALGAFSLNSLRGSIQPELSRRLYKLIKTSNNVVTAHETAGRERVSIGTQLSEWGEQTDDDAINDVSDKIGVILSEMGEQEDNYAHAMDDARNVLKQIRNTEKSVQPSRDNKRKIADEIARLKVKEPENIKLVTLEQELVRAEAENLVAEAQLTNTTRQKLKEAYDAEFLATIERAEKQIILARHGRRLIHLLDDSPIVPGEEPRPYHHGAQARQILNDAEDDLRDWQLDPHDLLNQFTPERKSPVENERSASSSPSAERKKLRRERAPSTDENEAVEHTPLANPQGEHESVQEREGRGDDVFGVQRGVDDNRLRINDTETLLPQSSQQLEGSAILTGSPVSSLDGWRVHANLFSPNTLPSAAY